MGGLNITPVTGRGSGPKNRPRHTRVFVSLVLCWEAETDAAVGPHYEKRQDTHRWNAVDVVVMATYQ